MKYTDLISGKYYYTDWVDGEGYKYILQYTPNKSDNIDLTHNKFYKARGCFERTDVVFRIATPFEIQWLQMCQKENKYIEFKEPIYELY